jgi:hypothetical protein
MAETMNIYQKIQAVKSGILKANLKKSWKNAFAKFDYYELSDIMPTIIELCNQWWLYTHITFSNEVATLTILNCEKPEETVQFQSPMRELELKGCNAIQSLWWIESYQRRYLYLMAFDISESDMFDAVSWKEEKKEKKEDVKWFNKEDLERLQGNTEYLKKFATSDDLIKDIQKYYWVSKEMKMKIADVRANVPEDK